MKFTEIAAVVMDMDGVLWRGDEALPGLVEWFEWLREGDFPYALATNNSSKTQADYVNKLARMGVADVPEERIITSSVATAAYLGGRYPAGTRVFVLGMNGLRVALDGAGFDLAEDADEPPQLVVAGVDFDLTYARLRQAALYIRNGAEFYGTNPDRTFPTPEGQVPGAGSILAALQAATDREPVIIGKPEQPMLEAALELLDQPASKVLMIGDRLNTDIAGGQRAGMRTALVFSGVTTPELLTASKDVWPDVAYEGLPDIISAWAGHDWYREKVKARRGR